MYREMAAENALRSHVKQRIDEVMLHDFPFMAAERLLILNRTDVSRLTGISMSRLKKLAEAKARSTKTERAALQWIIVKRTLSL